MSDTRFERPDAAHYTVDHLIVLIGGNPLPNLLAARQFLAPGGTLYPLFTVTSREIARHLLSVWQNTPRVTLPDRIDPGNDSTTIVKAVDQAVAAAHGKRLGLHYTGGTKRMALHSYRTLAQHLADGGDGARWISVPTLPFSYLDARTDYLYAHDLTLARCYAWSIRTDTNASADTDTGADTSTGASLGLDQLLQLHGRAIDWGKPPLPSPEYPAVADALRRLHMNSDLSHAWGGWLNGPYGPGGGNTPVPRNVRESFEGRAALQAMRAAGLCDGNVVRPSLSVISWLQGYFLESVALAALLEANRSYSLGLSSLLAGVTVARTEQGQMDFQIDAVAMRGHHLYVFSCKAYGDEGGRPRRELREGLAEARIRARQMGGDEAHTALLCFTDHQDELEAELRSDFDLLSEGADERIKVFGRADLGYLPDALGAWIAATSPAEGRGNVARGHR